MEFQPTGQLRLEREKSIVLIIVIFILTFILFLGYVNVQLLCEDSKDHYRWNKVTTCVHNLFGGQRSVDQYGELKITNLDRNISCKLTFVKVCFHNI